MTAYKKDRPSKTRDADERGEPSALAVNDLVIIRELVGGAMSAPRLRVDMRAIYGKSSAIGGEQVKALEYRLASEESMSDAVEAATSATAAAATAGRRHFVASECAAELEGLIDDYRESRAAAKLAVLRAAKVVARETQRVRLRVGGRLVADQALVMACAPRGCESIARNVLAVLETTGVRARLTRLRRRLEISMPS